MGKIVPIVAESDDPQTRDDIPAALAVVSDEEFQRVVADLLDERAERGDAPGA